MKPTRVTPNSETLIDNIYITPDKLTNTKAAILPHDLSDHYPCLLTISSILKNSTAQHKTITYRKETPEKYYLIKQDLLNHDWTNLLNCTLNEGVEHLTQTICQAYSHHCPLITKKCPKNKFIRERWMTHELIQTSKELYNSYKLVCKLDRKDPRHIDYINKRNTFNRDKRLAKQNYYSDYVKTHKDNPRKMWDLIKQKSGLTVDTDDCHSFKSAAGENITSNDSICREFNSFFSNVAKDTLDKLPTTNQSYLTFLDNPSMDIFQTQPLANTDIEEIILSIKLSSSSGPDNLSSKLLHSVASSISTPLALLINKSLTEGLFPDALKISKVIPIYKKGNKDEFTNYRPISLLSSISKIFEKAMHIQLTTFLTESNQFSPTQFGFRTNHTTIDTVSTLVADTIQGFENKQCTIAILLDISKAFDTIDHSILLTKLSYYGVKNQALSWLKNYLTNRQQYISYASTTSSHSSITSGIPQGSVLGPLLYSIYVNDLQKCITRCQVLQFADDTTIYCTGSNLTSMADDINFDLDKLFHYFTSNKLALSSAKTVGILFERPKINIPQIPVIKLNNVAITLSDTVKLLGVHLDRHLTWSIHINQIFNEISKYCYILNMVKHFLPFDALKMMYFGLIHSRLTYGILLWGSANANVLDPLNKIHKKTIRHINNAKYNASSSPLFAKCKILNLADLFKLECLKTMHRLHNNTLPLKLANFFSINANIHAHNTRQANSVHFNQFRLQSSLNSFLHQSPKLWLDVPLGLRSNPRRSSMVAWYRNLKLSNY